MSGLLLRTGRLREYNALGSVGRPVYSAASQLRALIKRTMGQDCADMLAIPQINEAGDTIDWYAPAGSTVVPWDAATEEERAPARQAVQQARQDFQSRSAEMQGQANGANKDMEVFSRLLPFATQIPDESHIHLVDGRPVITFWGFTRLNAAPEADVIRDLALRPAPVAAAAAVEPAVPLPLPVAQTWLQRWWWLLPMLFLLLLLLLLFGLRGFTALMEPAAITVPTEEIPKTELPAGTLPPVGVVPQIGVPQVAVPGVLVPGTTLPDGTVPRSGTGVVVPPGSTPENTPPKPDGIIDKPATTDPTKPPALDADKTLSPAKPDTPPPPPLTLPDKAMKDGSTAFLDGRWRSRTSLMDSQTGRPLEVEYDFKNGKGTATILRSDGSKCPAPVEANVQGGKLTLNQTADAKCADGQVFDRSKVECRPGKDGKAECRGVHADGGGYSVEIVK